MRKEPLLMVDSRTRTFRPAWWLPGPHAQTIWPKFLRKRTKLPLRAERIETPDGDFLDLLHLDSGPRAPRLLLLHGLEGTPRSHYVSGTFEEANSRGWSATLMLFRGCGPELNRARRFYHSGETSDLDLVVRRLTQGDEPPLLVLAGVSLGGNVVLKWLGEQGENALKVVRGAAVVSVPFDLERGCRNLQKGFARVYDRHFVRSLKSKALVKWAQHDALFDRAALERAVTIYDFDDVVTAPVHGFADAKDYYARSSSIRFLDRVRVPTLLLSAVDDPFLPPEVLDEVSAIAGDNPAIRLEFARRGGHVGFVGGRFPWSAEYYAERRVAAFLGETLR